MTIVTQTSTKMPYSKPPIQRASSTWLTKAMTALTMRMAEGDQRHAAGFAALVGGEQHGVDAAEQRPQRAAPGAAGKKRSAVIAAEKRTPLLSDLPHDRRAICETVKKRLGDEIRLDLNLVEVA